MCGIAGAAYSDGRVVDPSLVTRMTRALAHRGPDGEGFHFAPGIGLGHRRLAIIDLSPSGKQPMSNEDDSVWVSFNGEIYNHLELRAELMAKGHQFRSRADTEVIVHLYEELGVDALDRLRGMFAIALWDANERKLLLARDRIGIKPLFYAQASDGGLRFASEVKSLLVDPGLARDVDVEALDAYLAQNYVTAPATLLRGIRQLKPGEYLEFGNEKRVRVGGWWDIDFSAPATQKTIRQWDMALEEQLRDAVKSHLIADVPYGALLSGGVDSATLVGILSEEHDAATLTFTADFTEATFGEGQQARKVADALRAENHQVLFRAPTPEELKTIVVHADEPTADMSMLPFYSVCKLARQHVKVALSGEGADEVFAGYQTYSATLLAQGYRKIPEAVRGRVRRAIEALPDSSEKVSRIEKLKRFVRGAEFPDGSAHFAWRQICDAGLRNDLLLCGGGLRRDRPPGSEVLFEAGTKDRLNRLLYADLRHYLPNDMLVKADRMSMAHGLEVRVPFLDHHLVEFAATMPGNLKLRRLVLSKWILRRLCKRVVPRKAHPPTGKRGFNVPFGAWLRGPLREFSLDVLSPARLANQGLFRPAVVEQLLHQHDTQERDRSYEIYSLLVVALWKDHIKEAAVTAEA